MVESLPVTHPLPSQIQFARLLRKLSEIQELESCKRASKLVVETSTNESCIKKLETLGGAVVFLEAETGFYGCRIVKEETCRCKMDQSDQGNIWNHFTRLTRKKFGENRAAI